MCTSGLLRYLVSIMFVECMVVSIVSFRMIIVSFQLAEETKIIREEKVIKERNNFVIHLRLNGLYLSMV